MKGAAAAGPYELYRWKSSRGRLVVRTAWVKGVRHVVLSDDDGYDKRQTPSSSSSSSARQKNANGTAAAAANRPPLSAVRANGNSGPATTASDNNGDNYYVDRVLRWLQKPSATPLETQRKSVSAPGNGDGGGGTRGRRPALVKTCSIPEHSGTFDGDQQVVEIAERLTKSTGKNNNNNNNCTQNRHKIELHVHIPSACSTINDNNYY